jgi:parallel beta-helix repeat protein
MGRFFWHAVAAGLAALALGVNTAGAEPIGITLPPELPDPPVDPASIVTYQTALPGIGEVLADPAAVGDDELASVGAGTIEVAAMSGPADFVVDAPPVDCPQATFTSIQAAVTAAPPGSTILVCPGLYNEFVSVTKPLTLWAPRQQGTSTQCAETTDPTREAVVQSDSIFGVFLLGSAGITLQGFTIQENDQGPGVYATPAFSGLLRHNTFQRNVFGLYLNGATSDEKLVRQNCFRFNIKPGSANGNGIYSDQGLLNANVEENFFTGHFNGSMVFALNQADVVIRHNDVIDDNAIVLIDTQDAVVEYNHIVDTDSSGIFLGGGVTARIAYNLIVRPTTGISAAVVFVFAPNVLEIVKNHVKEPTLFDGIRLDDTDNSTVTGNKIERATRDGILLRNGSSDNTVANNLSRDNGRDGLRVNDTASGGNTIEQNKMLGNGEHDCHDDSVGPGTAGTANLWLRNIGKTENRPGLCKNATVTP